MKGSNNYKPIAEYTDQELLAAKSKLRHEQRKERQDDLASIETFSNIEPQPIEWLWLSRIAVGKLTIFAGDPGIGKSLAALFIAAMLSLAKPFPDGTPCRKGDTLILSSEDEPGDTIRPRLDALNADVSRIHYVEGRITKEGPTNIRVIDIEALRDAIDQVNMNNGNVEHLILDPLEGFLGGTDANKNTEVRKALSELIKLSREERFAILAIQHLNKGNASAAYRVGGSIAFTAFARSVWIFARDMRAPQRRVFLPLKNNLGADTIGFEYSIQTAPNGAPYIVWGKEVSDSIQDILSPPYRAQMNITPEQREVLTTLEQNHPHPLKTGEIAEQLEKQKPAVSNLLKKLKKSAQVHSPSYGHWQLSPNSSDSSVSLSGVVDETTESGEVSLVDHSVIKTDETAESSETFNIHMNGGTHG
ncbi:AAA family ATPase [Treponema sp. OttesenSCG-928-L16]|nr:AAA family ATPase [Treponema sp. OttesenSCG-928-L16]